MNVPALQTFNMPSPPEMNALIDFCKVMSSCTYYTKLGPGGIMSIYLQAKELGLPFMACLNGGMYTFSGVVSLSAQLMNMLIVSKGHKIDILQLDDKVCTILFRRGDRLNEEGYKGFTFSYTIDQAKTAGYLGKDNWRKHPADMLFARCMASGARKCFPDALANIYVQGELDGDDKASSKPIVENLPISNEPIKSLEELPKLEFVKSQGYDEFCSKHSLLFNENGEAVKESRKLNYIYITADKAKLHPIQVINAALKNEETFIKQFNKWEADKFPNK